MGKLIVIEGTDGSGKSTQFALLSKHLQEDQVAFKHIVFPRYNKESSALIRMYLGGAFGDKPSDVGAYAASAFYAVDRYASYKMDWGQWYEEGGLVLSDRYTTSNAVHQASKETGESQKEYLRWLYDFEYEKLGLPRPHKTVFLDMPVEISQKLLSARYNGDESKKDIHEQNVDFLKACREAALYVANRDGWIIIPCNNGDKPRTIEEINADLCGCISQYDE